MKKQLLGAVAALGILSAVSMQTFAVYLPGAQQAGLSVGTEWFFNQQDIAQPRLQSQCSEFWGQENYYLNGDLDADGIPDMGRQWYFKDNFLYSSATATRGVALIVPRFNQYSGTTVSYYRPANATNSLQIYHAGNQYSPTTQKAFYRFSKVAPLNQTVRAIESEPFLIEAPQTRQSADANIQIIFNVNFAPFSSWGTTTSDYFVATVAGFGDLNPVPNSNKRWMKGSLTNPDGPLWSSDYLNQTALVSARSINWAAEVEHGAECVNIKTFWCGDGVVSNGGFTNGVTASEQCDLGAQNGQPGSLCTATCQSVPVVQDPDVSIVKSVIGLTTGYQSNDIVTYRLLYRNIGTGLANNVVIRDELPAGMTFVSATSNPTIGTPTVAGQIITFPTIATLAPGAQGEIIIQARITQFAACMPYTNRGVIAATNEPIALNGNNASQVDITTQCPNPDVITQKSVSAISGSYLPGQTVEYTLTYQNIGAAVANGVIVTDTLPSQVTYILNSSTSIPNIGQPTVVGQTLTWNIGSLNPGQSGQIKIRVTIKANTPTCTSLLVRNDFTISATNEPSTLLDNNPSNATFPMQCLDLFSHKTVDKPVVVSGDIVTYTITYGNNGNVSRPGTVTDTLPSGMQYIVGSASSNPNVGQPTVNGQNLVWNVGVLPASSSRTITFQARVLGSTQGQSYLNTVCIADDNNYNNNNCGDAISVGTGTTGGNIKDFWSRKVVDKPIVVSGDIVTYTITYGNSGDIAWPGNIADTLPADIEYISGTSVSTPNLGQPSVTIAPGGHQILLWNGGTIPAGSTRTISFQARVRNAYPNQQFLNLVCIADDGNNDNNNCGTATSTTTGGGGGTLYDLSIIKSPASQVAYQGQDVTFTLLVRNEGPATATNFAVNDYLPAGLQFVSANPGATYNTTTRTITWNNLTLNANGTLTLTVVATYNSSSTEVNWTEICAYNGVNSGLSPRDVDSNPCNGTGNNEDDVSSGRVTSAYLDLNLDKLANGLKEVDVFSGEIVDFSLVVGNSGSVAASNFSVVDYLPVGFVYVQGSVGSSYDPATRKITWTGLTLSPGASTTLTFKATYIDNVERINYAEVCTYNGLNGTATGAKDIDSDPCNRGANPAVEDDESSAKVRPRTAQNSFDLSINKLIDGVKVKTSAVSGQSYPITLAVTNSGGVGVSNFSVRDYMPQGLDFVPGSANPANVSYDTGTRMVTFTGLNIGPNQTITLSFNAVYRDVVNRVNYTEICDYRGVNASGNAARDIDSNPCNRGATTAIEDDESSASIGPGGGGGGGPTVDVTLNKLVNNVKEYNALNGETVTFTLRASNEGNTTITNVSIVDYLPTNVEYVSGSASTGAGVTVSYDASTRKLVWSGLTFTNNTAFTLTFRAVYNGTEARTNYAEICQYNGRTINQTGLPTSSTNPQDPDSDPCNRGANAPVEDDESSALVKPRTGGCTSNCGGGGRNYCGDGVIARPNSYGQYEECDEGSNNGKAGYNCSTTCKTLRGSNPVCGNNTLEIGEVCDQGPNGGVIPAGRPYAGKTCTNKCDIPGITVPMCEYVDPPSIQSNEYLPYRWDLENIANVQTSCTGKPGAILRSSMICTFTVTDAKNSIVDQYDLPCYDRTPDVLTKSAYIQVVKSLGYDPDDQRIIPYGYDSRKFNFGNILGEHKISMTIKSYDQCDADGKGITFAVNKRVCEMNFAVTKPYMVSRGPLGNFTSDPAGLTEFLYMPDGLKVFTSPVPKMTTKFDVTPEVKDSIKKLVDEYKKVAVVAQSLPEFGDVSKVPGKEIYFFEGNKDDAFITISDKNAKALSDKPFTIIVTRGQLVVKGNLANAGNGMYINASANGTIKFAMDDKEGVNGVKGCDVTQQVHGIFISANTVESLDHQGNPVVVANTDQTKEWCNGGDLTVRGVLIGNGLADNVVARRRSNVNSWFNELTSINADRKEYLLNHGALVLKYNPELFDNLPPGAEILAQVLNTYKK